MFDLPSDSILNLLLVRSTSTVLYVWDQPLVLACTLLGLFVVWQLYIWMYNIYIHPLAAIPGPKLWAMSRVPCEFANLSGGIIKKIDFLHEKYGEIVRTGPDTVCFNNPDAWSEIYTQKSGQMLFPKDPVRHTRELWINGAPEIFTAENIDHPRLRRMLNPAFTNKALREQEPLIQDNVSLLIRKLQQQVGDGTSTLDIDKWINWTTFDLIGDLAFGETFDCMKNGGYHPWVALIFSSVRTVSMLGSIKQWPYLDALWELMISGLWNRAMRRFQSLVIEKVDRRLSKNSSRGDFLQSILEHKDPAEKMTRDELYSNSALLVMAGTETTATAVSGVVYHLARHPHILIPLQQEIRDKFGAESDMTFKAVAEISSLMAILNESMRLYPSVPATNPRRIPPGGARVMGQWLPEKTNVGIYQWAAYRSSRNFRNPDTFDPSRWQGNPLYLADRRAIFKPFGVGPKSCVGKQLAYAEMQLILVRLLWRFDFALADKEAVWTDQKVYWVWMRTPLMIELKVNDSIHRKEKIRS